MQLKWAFCKTLQNIALDGSCQLFLGPLILQGTLEGQSETYISNVSFIIFFKDASCSVVGRVRVAFKLHASFQGACNSFKTLRQNQAELFVLYTDKQIMNLSFYPTILKPHFNFFRFTKRHTSTKLVVAWNAYLTLYCHYFRAARVTASILHISTTSSRSRTQQE